MKNTSIEENLKIGKQFIYRFPKSKLKPKNKKQKELKFTVQIIFITSRYVGVRGMENDNSFVMYIDNYKNNLEKCIVRFLDDNERVKIYRSGDFCFDLDVNKKEGQDDNQ